MKGICHIHRGMTVDVMPCVCSLVSYPISERLSVKVEQVYGWECLRQPGQIQVIAVACPDDSDGCVSTPAVLLDQVHHLPTVSAKKGPGASCLLVITDLCAEEGMGDRQIGHMLFLVSQTAR